MVTAVILEANPNGKNQRLVVIAIMVVIFSVDVELHWWRHHELAMILTTAMIFAVDAKY